MPGVRYHHVISFRPCMVQLMCHGNRAYDVVASLYDHRRNGTDAVVGFEQALLGFDHLVAEIMCFDTGKGERMLLLFLGRDGLIVRKEGRTCAFIKAPV